MDKLEIPLVDFTQKKRKRVVKQSKVVRTPTEEPRREPSSKKKEASEPPKEKEKVKVKGKKKEKEKAKGPKQGGSKPSAKEKEGVILWEGKEVFSPGFHYFAKKRPVLASDSVREDPSVGWPLISGICLQKDVDAMPKSRNHLLRDLAAHIAMVSLGLFSVFSYFIHVFGKVGFDPSPFWQTAQTAAVCFDKIQATDEARERQRAELDRVHSAALEQWQSCIDEAKAAFVEESAAKATAEANLSQALGSLEAVRGELTAYKAGEEGRLFEAAKVGRDKTIASLKESVEDAKAQCCTKGMKQGFSLGYRMALEAAGVLKDNPLWTVLEAPGYEDSDAEASETRIGEKEDGTGEDVSSKRSGDPTGGKDAVDV